MKAAYDVGINFFDCAECYSIGESERIIGQAIKKYKWKRNDLVISTKIYWGGDFGSNPNNVGLSRKHIVEGLNGSLERLGLDYVDLVYAHRPDRNTPIEETVRGFNHVIDQGKAFYWGTSEWSADEIATAWRYAAKLGLIGPLMEQPCYNMLERDKVEREFRHLYESPYKLGLTVFSPLHGGLLSGKYSNGIPPDSRFAHKESDPIIKTLNTAIEGGDLGWVQKIETVKALEPLAKRLGISQTDLAYAWVLSNRNVSCAITGASRPQQIYDAVKALDVVKLLDKKILGEIDDILGNKPPAETRRFT
jgi:voltage-dependent potassium channel beta subunit